jgi:ABC-type lipoprotein release transport system permease subunit
VRKAFIVLRIAFFNVIKHRASSLVLLAVFTISTLVIFWAFGFGNSVSRLIRDSYNDSYGDLTFVTEYFNRQDVDNLLKESGIGNYFIERQISGMYESPRKGDLTNVVELTDANYESLKRWIKPIRGKIPEKPNEVMVPEVFLKGTFDLGDTIYIIASTPEKVINTIRYTIVGISKTIGVKGMPVGLLITQKSVDLLQDSDLYGNLVYVKLTDVQKQSPGPEVMYLRVKGLLEGNGIRIKTSWYLPKELEHFRVFMTVLDGMRYIILLILFPLVGAVVATIMWIYSKKRRFEIWTYVALGFKDRWVTVIIALEYWLLTLLGMVIGVGLGLGSSSLTYHSNIWLEFSTTFASPLMAIMDVKDYALLVLFMYFCVTAWIYPALNRIIKDRPFSY